MSAYNYVDTPNPNLTCCICRNPFVDPIATTTCSHTFCFECILGALSHAPQCPIDRSPLTPKELGPANSIVRALVDELLVECTHREQGCTHVCQRQLLPVHLREGCAYSEVACQERGCMETILRKEVHLHMDEKHEAGKKDNNANSEEMHEGGSSSKVFSCPQSKNGCPFSTPDVDNLSTHTKSCAYCGLEEFFGISATRHASLMEQNVLLRHRVSTLENSVQILRREMEVVRHALSPWCRTERAATHRSAEMNYDGLQPRPLALVRHEDLASLEGQNLNQNGGTIMPATSSGRVASNTDALAPYFPSTVEDDISRGPVAIASSTHMGQGHHEAYTLGLGLPPMRTTPMLPHITPQASTTRYAPGNIVTVPRLSSVIAPLDLGSTVESTLNGLRDSMLTLAAGVDSLGRRSEIALTNDSLKFGEEIMSLRANINGLRMQVHAMMMERNAQVTGGSVMAEVGLVPPRPFYPPVGVQGQVPTSITKL